MADFTRIKGNISKMLAQGAPETDIDAYLSSEGVTADQLKAAPKAPEADPYAAEARAEYDRLKAKGVPVEPGMARMAAQGMGLGGTDEIMAALNTPGEMIRRGTFNPVEGYRSAKAFENVRLEEARKAHPILAPLSEAAGGAVSGGGIARAGYTLVPRGAGAIGRILGMGAEGAGYGGTQGFLDGGDSLSDRLSGAGRGILFGGGAGIAIPAVVSTVAAPIISAIRARINPSGVATSQLARATDEIGRHPGDILDSVRVAATEGQPMYTVADEMGMPGQRLLRTATQASGKGRAKTADFLEQRQAGQGDRIGQFVEEGFDVPRGVTAKQAEAALTEARSKAAKAEYPQTGGPVDPTGVISKIDETLQPGVNKFVNPQSNIADDGLEATLRKYRNRITDDKSVNTDYGSLQRLRVDISDAIQADPKSNQSRYLRDVLKELDTALEGASYGFKSANAKFAARSRVIDAIEKGRNAAGRVRPEDANPTFQAMNPAEQQAHNIGFVDPIILRAQEAGGTGVNAARPLTRDSFVQKADVMAPNAELMNRQIARENVMHQTRADALGGSRTDMNLIGASEQGIDPASAIAVGGDVATGNVYGLLSRLAGAVGRGATGSTPAVRERLAQMLLTRGAGAGPLDDQMMNELVRAIRNRRIYEGALRGTAIAAGGSSNH